tara:strand:+ start:1179 stop:1463 length:285 start_codon:yes stop_codon:yes gene_type:complete
LIEYEIPLLIVKIIANITLLFTIFLTWKFKITPSYCAPLFFVFNLSGLFFLSVGIKEEITTLITGASFIIFVSYILIISFLTDKYFQNKKAKNK